MRDIKPVPRKKRLAPEAEDSPSHESGRSGVLRGSAVPVTTIHVPRTAKQRAGHERWRVRLGHRERKLLLSLFGLLLFVILGAALLFLPAASIRLVLRTAPLLVDESLQLRAGSSSDSHTVPATVFFRELQITGEAPVNSRQMIGTKTAGDVDIVNTATTEQKIKEGSRLVTREGTLFFMKTHAIVPGASSGGPGRASVLVEAAEPGAAGNIEPQRLNFAALDEASQSIVYAEAGHALSGGSGQEVGIVQESDLEAARAAAREAARQQVEAAIRGELTPGWVLLEESWTTELLTFDTSVQIGEQRPVIPYTSRVVVRAIGFAEATVEEALRAALMARLDDEYDLFPGPLSYTKTIDRVDWERGEADITARVTHTTIPNLSLDTLQEKLAGRTRSAALEYLEGLPGVRSAEVRLRPFWVRSVPRIEKRIQIDLVPERQP